MDGQRWKCLFAGVLISNFIGCSWLNSSKQPGFPTPPPPPPTSTASAKSLYIPEPGDDEASKKEGPLSAATLLVFAGTWVDAVANDPNKPAVERERLLTQAREQYQEILKREPKNIEALFGLARLYQVTGEAERAQEVEQRLREAHPNNPKVYAWIAVRMGQIKDWDAAAQNYHHAVKLDPDNRMYRIQLGFTLARANRYEEGFAWLNKSMRETEARYNLSMMMVHNGHNDQARRQLQIALRADPNYKAAADQLAMLEGGNQKGMPKQDSDVRIVGHQDPTPTPAMPAGPKKIILDPDAAE
jgi:tetratricopeptide (TPR) repeat protein